MDDGPCEVSVEDVYGGDPIDTGPLLHRWFRLFGPRSPEMLFDEVDELGIGEGAYVLDAGSGEGRHTCELARRYGCHVLGVELVTASIETARRLIERMGLSELVTIIQGDVERLPAAAGAFDLVWCREVLNHVPDLRAAFTEYRRTLRPGGSLLVYTVFATDTLEPDEMRQVCGPLAHPPQSLSRSYFESCADEAGLRVAKRTEIHGEWREFEEEKRQRTSMQLLRISQMQRTREWLTRELGKKRFEIELANCYWGVYIMLGKLCPTMYVMRRDP